MKLPIKKQFDKAQEEILITWPSLLKIFFGSLLTLLLIIFGFIRQPLPGTVLNQNPFQNPVLQSSLEQDPGLTTDVDRAC